MLYKPEKDEVLSCKLQKDLANQNMMSEAHVTRNSPEVAVSSQAQKSSTLGMFIQK